MTLERNVIFDDVELQRLLLRRGARIAASMAPIFLGLGATTDWPFLRPFALASIFAFGCYLMQRRKTPRVAPVLFAGALAVIAAGATAGGVGTTAYATPMATVMLFSAAGLFIPFRLRVRYGLVVVSLILVAGLLWEGGNLNGAVAGVTMAAVYGFAATTLRALQSAALTVERGSHMKSDYLDRVPVPILTVDLALIMEALKDLREAGINDIAGHVAGDATELTRLLLLGRIVGVNANAGIIFGFTERELPIPLAGAAIGGENLAVCGELLQSLADGETTVDCTFRVSDDLAGRWLRATWFVPTSSGVPNYSRAILAGVDISEVIAVQEQLSDLTAGKDRFIATISHELRTPLAGVLGFAHLLSESHQEFSTSEMEECIDSIVDQATDMADMIDDLLVAARAQNGSLAIVAETLDIAQLVQRAVRDTGVAFQGSLPEGLTVFADPGRTRQVLRNLVSNAEKYGGLHKRVLLVSAAQAVTIEFRNDGDPVPEALAESIFEPFFSAHRPSTSTESVGLGLWVSRHLAGLMGGALEYRYGDGEVVFALSLPSAAPSLVAG